jgi:hypothetical protein
MPRGLSRENPPPGVGAVLQADQPRMPSRWSTAARVRALSRARARLLLVPAPTASGEAAPLPLHQSGYLLAPIAELTLPGSRCDR